MNTIRTTCSYCSVGCNFDAVLDDQGRLQSFRPAVDYPVNLGKSCPKGFHLMSAFQAEDRATRPLLRDASGSMQPVSWNRALTVFVERFKEIKSRYGPEGMAFISTGQMPTEEMALLGALFKFGMGGIHGDGNTRQCMATAAVAYKQAFGFDAPPFTYKDFELSDLLVFVGSNATISHPVMWNRVKMNRRDPHIVVVDPRRTKTAAAAHTHLALKPKGDLALLYALTHVLIREGWVDRDFVRDHTEGFDELAAHVGKYAPEAVADTTGIEPQAVRDLARRIHEARAVSFWWTMGVNQSHEGVRTAQAIINICLITGNIGRPGTGPNSITGQANAMGSRLFSNTTSLFAGYDFAKEEDRKTIADRLGISPELIPDRNSLPYHKILERVAEGSIRGLWIIATNPAHSWIDKNTLFERLGRLDFLVVQDLYHTTETAVRADLLLPAAGSGEKSGTFINSERRLGIVDKIADPPGEARTDFDIFKAVAERWGCGELFASWTNPEAVFRILQRCSAGRPCDITGIQGYRMIRERGGIQWPYPAGSSSEDPERRLFADGRFFTPSGRARLIFEDSRPAPEELSPEFPLVLLTGRGTLVQWHTQTRTGKVAELNRLSPENCFVQVSPMDAKRIGISDGDRAEVSSRRGSVVVDAVISDEVKPGEVFMPMHYEETNRLTYPAFDTYSAEPAYKHAAVAVRPAPAAGPAGGPVTGGFHPDRR
ncbi:MAG: nitrate reductase [Spirochaetales bacterium]|nr:nitrate reductase [Spirochaetales bacterium]